MTPLLVVFLLMLACCIAPYILLPADISLTAFESAKALITSGQFAKAEKAFQALAERRAKARLFGTTQIIPFINNPQSKRHGLNPLSTGVSVLALSKTLPHNSIDSLDPFVSNHAIEALPRAAQT